MSGEITSAGIDLAMPAGLLHLTPGTMQGFESATHGLDVAAADRKRQLAQEKRAEDDLKRVAALTQAVSGYNQRIAGNKVGPEDIRKEEEGLVAAARKELAGQRRLAAQHRQFDASQAGFRVGQIAFRLNLIRMQVEQDVRMGHEHIAELDREVTTNPCVAQSSIPGCVALAGELTRYQATRTKVQSELQQLTKDLGTNMSAMDAINKAAGN